jgi:integrase
MDISNLKEKHTQLINHLKEQGYRANYIRSFKSEINKIIKVGMCPGVKSYEDYYKTYLTQGLSKRALDQRRQVIGLIKQFDYEGKFPSKAYPYRLFQVNWYNILSSDFKKAVDIWELYIRETGQKESSVTTKRQTFISFLSHLNSYGVQTFDNVTEHMVLSYFFVDDKIIRGHTTCCRLKCIIKECMLSLPNGAYKKILLHIPAIKNIKKNYPYLTEEESNKIMSVLKDTFSGLSLRDRAIGLLALLCGLRSYDIASLQFGNINWEKEKISIVQQKTGVPLTLPFCPLVGNVIYDYIMEERPKKVSENHIFLINDREIRHISRHLSHVCERILLKAGISSDRERKGCHLFRHRFGVMLLNKGIPQAVITAALGHVSPASLDIYLDSDLGRLKECGRSIEKFPVGKEVFI